MNEDWKCCLTKEEVDSFSVATNDIMLKSEKTTTVLFLKQLPCTKSSEGYVITSLLQMRKLQFNKGYAACGLTGRKWKV